MVRRKKQMFDMEFELYGENDEYILAQDVGYILGYDKTNIANMVALTEHKATGKYLGRRQWFVTQEGVLDIILHSTKPQAMAYKERIKDVIKMLIYAT